MASTNWRAELKKLLKTQKPRFVYWVDPTSYAPWQNVEDAKQMECMGQWSLGWLIDRDDDTILLALNLAEEREQISNHVVMPKACVKAMIGVKM